MKDPFSDQENQKPIQWDVIAIWLVVMIGTSVFWYYFIGWLAS
mgnify:CR=1 FL=1